MEPDAGNGERGVADQRETRPPLPSVRTAQRFNERIPCPVCRGYDAQPRQQGQRCFGYFSLDGRFAYCTREEFAGPISINEVNKAYRHRLEGECRCGTRHDGASPEAFRAPAPRRAKRTRRRAAVYRYFDAVDVLRYDVVRRPGKRFSVRRPNGQGGWVWNMQGVRCVLYRLPQLIAADPERPVFIVEGEKDVNRLRREGLVATTNPFGARKWREEYTAYLEGRRVVILHDNDDQGRRHALQVAGSVLPVGAWVKWAELPGVGPKEDVSDWLAAGNTVAALMQLVEQTPTLQPANLARLATPAARETPWDQALAAPDFVRQTPDAVDWIVPDLLARGAITSLAAPRGLGKSITAMHLAVELARGGTFRGQRLAPVRVLYLDRDNPPVVTKIRLVAWGGASERTLKVLMRDQAPDLLHKQAWAQFPAEAFDVVIIDAVGSSTEGVTEKEGRETSLILARLRDLAAKGVAVLLLHNTTKGGEHYKGRGEWADRLDILFEVRDATGLQPSGQKPWWQELPSAAEADWGARAARRQQRTTLRTAFIPSKFRLGPEPAPFCLESVLPAEEPWVLREVTDLLTTTGERKQSKAEFDRLAQRTRALFALTGEIEARDAEGKPLSKTEAVKLLCNGGFPRQAARTFIEEGDGKRWRLELTRQGTGRQRAYAVLPLSASDTIAS